MEMYCPECLGPMVTTDGKSARCTLHGGMYRILFWREGPRAPRRPVPDFVPAVDASAPNPSPYASPAPAIRSCAWHPAVHAPHTCAACLTSICETCSFTQPDGRRLCPDCAVPGPMFDAPSPLAGVVCSNHSEVQAVAKCHVCGRPVCATCDFAMPGNIHVCPNCASKRDPGLSKKRKGLLYWSYALAIWSTLAVALWFAALANMNANGPDVAALGALIYLVAFIPSLIGTALGVGTFDRRLSNPASIWGAVIWNGAILSMLLLLTIVGTFMS